MAKKKMIAPLKVNRVGAPNKPSAEKKDPNTGITQLQKDWIQKEADGRGVARTDIMREAVEMYITAIESQRGDSIVSELFDGNLKTKTQEK